MYLKSISGGLNSKTGKEMTAGMNKAVSYLTATVLTSDPNTQGYVYPESLDLTDATSIMK
jgi:hypothetical protein